MIRRFLKFLILVAVVGGLGLAGFIAIRERKINVNEWFVGSFTKGVDVSSYQTEVDFEKLREQGIEFAYIKATEGATHVDPSFAEKWAAALDAEVPAGAYHYFSYGVSGAAQAQSFIAAMGDLGPGRLIPAVDMELTTEEVYNPPEVDAVVVSLRSFLAVLEERYGVKPLIYAQQDYYDKYLATDFADYPRWVRNVFYPAYVKAGENWAVWQYNDRGVLEGYGGEKYIDLNVLNSNSGLEALKISS